MIRILQFDKTAVKKLITIPQLQYYSIVNVLILGILYGLSASQLGQAVLLNKGLETAAFSPYKIVFIGVSVAFLMHGGAALFVWVFLRALGGNPNFMPAYLSIGVGCISLWPLVPFAAALQAGINNMAVMVITAILSMYGLAVNYVVVQTVSGLSNVKMGIAATATLVYIGCFLYLWI